MHNGWQEIFSDRQEFIYIVNKLFVKLEFVEESMRGTAGLQVPAVSMFLDLKPGSFSKLEEYLISWNSSNPSLYFIQKSKTDFLIVSSMLINVLCKE